MQDFNELSLIVFDMLIKKIINNQKQEPEVTCKWLS